MSAKGGITEGKSHKEGGIPMVVESTGQHVELEGGEGVINKRNMASTKTFEFEGKEKTICEIASEINSADGNGVQIDCDNVTGKKYKYDKGGKILNEDEEESFKEWMEDGNVHKFEDGYSTQDSQWRNRLKGLDELRRYFRKEFLSDSYEIGGSVQDYKSLIGKYVNIYSMGVSLPSEHQIKDVMVSGENFRYRYITLKFDIGIAPIPLDEGMAFMNNEIIYVNDNKEEFGIQLIPNQYAKGGRMSNSSKLEDYETTSMSAGGYEEQMIVPQSTTGIYQEGGGVSSLGNYTAIANMGIRKIKRNLDSVLEVQEFMTEMADKNAISVEITKISQEGKKQTIVYEWSGSDWEVISKSNIYQEGGGVEEKKKVTTYKQLENHPLVDFIEKEYNAGAFDYSDYSYWLYLKDGYVFQDLESTSLHEGSKGNLIKAFNDEKVFKKSSSSNKKIDTDNVVSENLYRISISENDQYIGEYPNPIESLMEAKTIFAQLANKYKRPQYLINVSRRPTSSSGYEKINVDEWYAFVESFERGGDVRDMSWYQDFKNQELKRGTKHEMEHIDTIRDFKKKGVSDREVAEAIAKDHLEEDENYYIELDKMESSRKLSEAIKEFEKHRGYRKNSHKFKHGGYMGGGNDSIEIVHIAFNSDVDAVIRDKQGKYISESKFPKETIHKFTFRHNDGRNTTLELGKGAFIVVPNSKINIVGFNEQKYGNGGSVKAYQSIPFSENDKKIAKMLTQFTNPASFNSRQRQKLSTFRGSNVVNELSSGLIQKIYGLLFEYHNIENPIKQLYLSNVGAGNIVSYAPKYVDKLMIDFDESNRFVEIEKEINAIINVDKKYTLSNPLDLRFMDAFIHVYGNTNPDKEELNYLFLQSDKTAVALGVCEFTSRERLDKFQRQIVENQGGFSQNQMIQNKNTNKYLIVNEGITDEGQYTLIYVMTKS